MHITTDEVAQLQRFMELNRAIDPHSANKARTYLGELIRQSLVDKELGPRAAAFVDAARGVSSGRLQWRDLERTMRGWF